MKKILIILLCTISFSCISQKEVINRSTIKLGETNTNIRNLIKIDGYFPVSSNLRYGAIMFFEDGTWVYFGINTNLSEDEIKKNLSRSVISWDKKKKNQWGTYWGVYSIQNDTIIVHSYNRPALLNPLATNEIRYKVMDKSTIREIYFRINSKAADEYYETHSPWIDKEPMHFTPADTLPSSDNWLKEKKWIWHNESDWIEYIQKIKQKKYDN